ncbi:MAG: hypothetical protein HYU66_25835, partial [Armatimonadetes bacterium]|nr:hypothetical protein [Armatimonadota bacterium]
ARLAAETGEAELALDSERVAAAVAEAQGDSAGAAERLLGVATAWLDQRQRLTAGGVEEALLEDVGRLTTLRRCVTLLSATGAEGRARELLTRAAWPPLLEELPGLAEE